MNRMAKPANAHKRKPVVYLRDARDQERQRRRELDRQKRANVDETTAEPRHRQ